MPGAASATEAETLGVTFSKVKQGAPVDAATLDCLTRALSEPLRLERPAHRPFPAQFEDEVPLVFSFGGAG